MSGGMDKTGRNRETKNKIGKIRKEVCKET